MAKELRYTVKNISKKYDNKKFAVVDNTDGEFILEVRATADTEAAAKEAERKCQSHADFKNLISK